MDIYINTLGVHVFAFSFFVGGFFAFLDHQILYLARLSICLLTQIHGPLVTLSLPRVFKKSSRAYMAAAMCLHPSLDCLYTYILLEVHCRCSHL